MNCRRYGFTLIELMIVVAVTIILAATSVAYGGQYLARRQVEGAAFQLVQDLRQTQATATFRRQTLKVTFDIAGNDYMFEKEAGGATMRRDFNSAIGYASVVFSGATEDGSSVDFGSGSVERPPTSAVAYLYFTPQGSASTSVAWLGAAEGRVSLSTRGGVIIDVFISPVIGRVRMAWR